MTAKSFDNLDWAKGDRISVYTEHSKIEIFLVHGVDFEHRTVLIRWGAKEQSVLYKNILARIRNSEKIRDQQTKQILKA